MAATFSKDEIDAACISVTLSLGYSLQEQQKEVIILSLKEMYLLYCRPVMAKVSVTPVYLAYLISFLML